MRWIPFALCMLAALTGQAAWAPRLELWGARPDGLLVIVVFLALHGAAGDALVAAWLVGVLADLMTIERLGFFSATYVLVAGAVLVVREGLFRESPAVQVLVVLVTGLLVRGVWLAYRALTVGWDDETWRVMLIDGGWSAVYTGLWAAPMLAVLWRLRGAFGVARRRYAWAGLESLEPGHV